MKTLQQIREQTLNEDKKWSWEAKGAPDIDDLIYSKGKDAIEMVLVSVDFGSYDLASSFSESVYHYMGGVNMDNSGIYFDEGCANKKGTTEFDMPKTLEKKYDAALETDYDNAGDVYTKAGYTWIHMGGPTKHLLELFTLKGSRGWDWISQIPRAKLNKAISDVKRNRKFTGVQ